LIREEIRMNKTYIIGNVTHTPESKTVSTSSGDAAVCTFTVAVNKRNGEADFFRVTAWRKLAETCARFIQKGKKVAVVGSVSARAYTSRDGGARASLELNADEVEFLSPRESEQLQDAPQAQGYQRQTPPEGFADVTDEEGLPF
jgi:single-strand DNA-binding protein